MLIFGLFGSGLHNTAAGIKFFTGGKPWPLSNYRLMGLVQSSFITGFPGFIAGRLVERLSFADVDRQFILLVQPEFVKTARVEIEKISLQTAAPLENFSIAVGDITKPHLGILPEDLDEIKDEVTDVFHLAAVYDLDVEQDLAHKVNVEGTQNVNELCASLRNLNRYNYISTCYVAGKRKGLILESDLEHDAGFRNHYEETKYLAEMEVEGLKDELPVTIYRPSVVVGDSKTGETAKYDGLYSLIHYLRMAPALLRVINVGNNIVKLNLVPVDFVVEGIASLAENEKALGKTVALADPEPQTTAELFETLAFAMTGKRPVLTPPTRLVESSLMLPFSPALSGLPHSGVPYFFISQTYDTSVADSLLAEKGIKCPRFPDYVKNLLDFVEKHPTL